MSDKVRNHDWKLHDGEFAYICCRSCGVSLKAARHFGWACPYHAMVINGETRISVALEPKRLTQDGSQ